MPGVASHTCSRQGMTYHRLFEMDYDKHSGEYRMTDNFLPQVRCWGAQWTNGALAE